MCPDLRIPATTSASQLVTYAMCPRKYAMSYVYGRTPEFRSLALILGSAMHSAIGWYFERALLGGEPTVEAAEEILAADLLAESVGHEVRWKDKTPESVEAECRKLLRLYLTEKADLPVVATEELFQVDLQDPNTGEFVGRPMKGYFDFRLEGNRVVELKTSSRGWSDFDLIRHLQVGAYAFAWNALHGGPSELEIHVIVKLKREPRVETYRIERGEEATRWWLESAREIEAAIAGGHFPPSPSALCRECEYERACANWVGGDEFADDTEPCAPLLDERAATFEL